MLVQEQPSARISIGSLSNPEDALAFRVQEPFPNEVVDFTTRHERWVELHQGGGPEAFGIILGINVPLDVVGSDANEGAGKSLVVSNQPVAKRENVHVGPENPPLPKSIVADMPSSEEPPTGETFWSVSNGVSKPFFAALLTLFAREAGAGRERMI